MAAKYWLKLYMEILDDPKMGRLSDNLWRRAIEMFLLAGELDEDGFLPAIGDMAWRLRRDQNTLHTELSQLAAVGIVEIRKYDVFGDQRWFVTNFAKRQAPSSAAKRMREYRKRRREERQIAQKKERRVTQKKERNVKAERDTDTDTDTYRDVTSDVTGSVTPVTKRNGLPKSNEKAVEMVTALMDRWVELTGGGLPTDVDKRVEDYFKPANALLRRVAWDSGRAFQLLEEGRSKMLQDGKTPYRLAAVVPFVLAGLDGLDRADVVSDEDQNQEILRYING